MSTAADDRTLKVNIRLHCNHKAIWNDNYVSEHVVLLQGLEEVNGVTEYDPLEQLKKKLFYRF